MNLFLKPKENKDGFYVDADGNTYIQDGDWFIPLYPHKIHRNKVYVIAMNGHKKTNVGSLKQARNHSSKYKVPKTQCDISSGG